jgi:hypothetical protein
MGQDAGRTGAPREKAGVAASVRHRQDAGDGFDELAGTEGLGQHRTTVGFGFVVAGNAHQVAGDDGAAAKERGVFLAQLLEQEAAGLAGQVPVEDDGVEAVAVETGDGFGGRRRIVHGGAGNAQDAGRHRANVGVVLDDEHATAQAGPGGSRLRVAVVHAHHDYAVSWAALPEGRRLLHGATVVAAARPRCGPAGARA